MSCYAHAPRAYIFHIGKSRLICTFDNDDEKKENLTIDGVKRKTADDGKLYEFAKQGRQRRNISVSPLLKIQNNNSTVRRRCLR